MTLQSKKYLNKRRQLIEIMKTISVHYETRELSINASPDFWEVLTQAELILSKFGINKTEELKSLETPTSVLG